MENVVRFIFGIFGNVSALFLFLSPVVTFRRILKNRSTEDFSGVPYNMTLLNCLLSACKQHSDLDDQWHRVRARGDIRDDVPGIRAEEDEGEDDGALRSGVLRVRGSFSSLSASLPRREHKEDLLWHRSRRLLRLYVCLTSSSHEVGYPNKERGVHALPPLALLLPVRNVVVHLRDPWPRCVHHGAERLWLRTRDVPADPLCNVQEEQGTWEDCGCERRCCTDGGCQADRDRWWWWWWCQACPEQREQRRRSIGSKCSTLLSFFLSLLMLCYFLACFPVS